MSGLFSADQLQQILAASQARPVAPQANPFQNPWEAMAFNVGNTAGQSFGKIQQQQGLFNQLAQAKAVEDQAKAAETQAITDIQASTSDPTEKFMKTGDYFLQKGDAKTANNYFQRAEERLNMDLRKAGQDESKRSNLVRERQADARMALEDGRLKAYQSSVDFLKKGLP